jgi:hypothetical protein
VENITFPIWTLYIPRTYLLLSVVNTFLFFHQHRWSNIPSSSHNHDHNLNILHGHILSLIANSGKMSQLTTPHPRKTYDFSPFLSSHIITSRLPPHTPPTALPIPESLIASPLAPNLAPATILDLKEFLTGVSLTGLSVTYGALAGNGCWNGIGKDNGREKGTEVWECWKRAYDLWNGCYVEGRVDPVWMREEYERIKKEPEEERERERKHQYAPRGKKQMPPSTGNTPPSVGDNWSTQADNGMEPGEDIYPTFTTPISRGTPPIPTLRSAEEVAKEDGSTGDFMPMKLLPEYFAPPTDAGGNYPEDWEDVLANTVWRPRRVGERELEVGIDGEWWQKSEFEFDGGVDCGRSPYPVRYSFFFLAYNFCFVSLPLFRTRLFRLLGKMTADVVDTVLAICGRILEKRWLLPEKESLGRCHRHHLQHAHSACLNNQHR